MEQDMRNDVDAIAKVKEWSQSQVIRKAVAEFIERSRKKGEIK